MEVFSKIVRYLKDKEVYAKPIAFEQDTATCETAAATLGVEVGQIAKTILFMGNGKIPVLVVACGDVKINSGKLKRYLGVSKVRMADPQTVLELTGYEVGGVCPVALPNTIPVLLEEGMKRFEVVYAAAGTPKSALPLNIEELQKATDGVWVELV